MDNYEYDIGYSISSDNVIESIKNNFQSIDKNFPQIFEKYISKIYLDLDKTKNTPVNEVNKLILNKI